MLTFEEARNAAIAYGELNHARWFEDVQHIDRGHYWFFPVGNIGSTGVLVDKKTGAVTPLGSGYPLDLQFWAFDCGLAEKAGIRITRVHDIANTVEYLLYVHDDGPRRTPNPNARRVWLRDRLENLPCDWPPQWFSLHSLREASDQQWFEFEVIPHASP